ncbi:NfeD family protein [Arcanobacterium haemolyticum]|nr:NfeD family protein [Arcanobacterium haemolyticum]
MSWIVWLIIAVVCIIVETVTVDFTFLMLAGAALIATGVSAFTHNLIIQVVIFAIASIILVLFARPWAKNKMNPRGAQAGNVYSQVGRAARTLTLVDAHAGRVKIGGDVWSARTDDGQIPEGSDVVVVRIDGAVAVVQSIPTPSVH